MAGARHLRRRRAGSAPQTAGTTCTRTHTCSSGILNVTSLISQITDNWKPNTGAPQNYQLLCEAGPNRLPLVLPHLVRVPLTIDLASMVLGSPTEHGPKGGRGKSLWSWGLHFSKCLWAAAVSCEYKYILGQQCCMQACPSPSNREAAAVGVFSRSGCSSASKPVQFQEAVMLHLCAAFDFRSHNSLGRIIRRACIWSKRRTAGERGWLEQAREGTAGIAGGSRRRGRGGSRSCTYWRDSAHLASKGRRLP